MSIRILLVDDFEPWRCFVYSAVHTADPELQIIGAVSDGLAAVEKAEELNPDLILLDIGLPKLNGIGAARRIREVAPKSKILFLSLHSSSDVVQEALGIGAGFVVKADAYRELLLAIRSVTLDKQFLSSSLESHSVGELRVH